MKPSPLSAAAFVGIACLASPARAFEVDTWCGSSISDVVEANSDQGVMFEPVDDKRVPGLVQALTFLTGEPLNSGGSAFVLRKGKATVAVLVEANGCVVRFDL